MLSLAVLVLVGIASLGGLILGLLANRPASSEDAFVDQVNDVLPQTQCAQCGYPGCRPYAEAIVNRIVDIDRCPPGGMAVRQALADLVGQQAPPLARDLVAAPPGLVAVIDSERCIGCARCLPACPVDAIVGAPQLLHGVIEDHCTGCELCLPPCPVDCIDLVPAADRI